MRDYKPSENSMRIYSARYLDEDARTPDALWRRVSGGNSEYYNLMQEGLFLPNSPTLFNAGKKEGGTLSACFVFDVADALLGDWPDGGCPHPFADSIAGTTFKAMAVAKAGGGVGYYLGKIREQGALVHSTHKRACGPVGVLRWLNNINELITQGGKRALAQMAILDAHHKDIRKFIHCKDDHPHELSSFNISVSWRDAMLEKVDFQNLFESDGSARRFDEESPSALWVEQCHSAHKTGDPGMYFWTTTNAANATPHLGDINATNPCGETPNLTDEPCNLGSSVLSRFFKKVGRGWAFMWDEFKTRVRQMIRFMDDILDWNVFPHPDITRRAMSTRKLGLGVMGYADALALMNVPYDSKEAVSWGSEVMKVMSETALDESRSLAESKGPYPAYETSSPETRLRFGKCRNSTRTSIAPTGTIALLADASSSIEPHYALEWERTTNEGIRLKERIAIADELNGFEPKTAMQIHWKWHVAHQAAFQKYTDLGVSKTINMPNDATPKDVSDAYETMWRSGCKGGTVFRDGCRTEQVLRETRPKSVYVQLGEPAQRRKLPKERKGSTVKFDIGGCEGYLTANVYEDGTLGEIFIELAHDGSFLAGMTKSLAKTFSVSLQNGTPLKDLIELHKNSVFEPRGMTGDPEVPNCTSIADYIVRKLEARFLKAPAALVKTGVFCPDCSSELVREGSCMKCLKPGCGFSKC